MTTPHPAQARVAVAAIFCANGILIASWISRIPDVKQRLELSEGTLGLALLCLAIGALIAQPTTGYLVGRFGSRPLTIIAGLVFCACLMLPAFGTTLPTLMGALLVLGALNGGLDVAMNAQGAVVEEQVGKPIMSSFHGFWSIGGLIGAALGGLAAARGLPLVVHFGIAAVGGLLIMGVASLRLWRDAPHASDAPAFGLPPRALLPLGVVAFIVLLTEGAVADWSGVYLRNALGSGAGLAATGYAAFALLMAVCRLAGDTVIARIGARRVVRGGGLLMALGMALALLSPVVWLSIAGFAAVGAGLAILFPITLSAAARTPGIAPGAAIAGMATAGYTGFLAGPAVIGFLAELLTLRGALWLLVAGGVVVVVLGGRIEKETRRQGD